MLRGFDVSHYQGHRRLDGAAFVIAKATEGTSFVDQLHGWFRDEAARIGAVFGSYHFAHPGNSVSREVDHFLTTAKPQPGELVALDLEATDGRSATRVSTWARSWLERVAEATGASPLLYCNRSFIEGGYTDGCESFPLWIADPGRDAGNPRHPHWSVWSLHQYSTAGNIDHDVANFSTKTQLRKLAVPAGHTPPPPPPPISVPDDWMERIMNRLPTLARGAEDTAGHVHYVRRLQGLLNALGPDIAIDGDFGPITEGRVMEEQRQYGIAVDGIVGPVTWSYLVTGSRP